MFQDNRKAGIQVLRMDSLLQRRSKILFSQSDIFWKPGTITIRAQIFKASLFNCVLGCFLDFILLIKFLPISLKV
jgi:hypothetical protein